MPLQHDGSDYTVQINGTEATEVQINGTTVWVAPDDSADDYDMTTLDAGQSVSGTLQWQTASGDAGDYDVTAETDDTSDTATVSVTTTST